MVNKPQISAFHHALFHWYDAHGRKDLPWRTTNDPYHIYLSEVMLQQTQVKTVLERFYFPFLERFPTLTALAEAAQGDVLKAWEGLGYYSRARNLHEAAKRVTLGAITPPPGGESKYEAQRTYFGGGALPTTIDELTALPGIGKNTAHAIAAFAFKQPVSVMEANVKRVLCRIFAMETPSEKELWERAASLVSHDDPFTYNQAMMDIGSTICTPKAPACLTCPAAKICEGKASPEAYPQKKIKKAVPTRSPNIIIIEDTNGALHMTPRETQFLGGMYRFIELDAGETALTFMGRCIPLTSLKKLGTVTHTYSHFKLNAPVYHHRLDIAGNGKQWLSREAITKLPLSGADKKVLKLLK